MTAIATIREFDTPKSPDDMHSAAEISKWCLMLYRVTPQRHFLATDGLRCLCIFDAPDAEAMRNVMRGAGFPEPLGLWPVTVHPGPDADRPQDSHNTLVVVERRFERPVTFEEIDDLEKAGGGCFNLHRVRFVGSYFATDRRNMFCIYDAPDAESVRIANRQAGLPFHKVWPTQMVVVGSA